MASVRMMAWENSIPQSNDRYQKEAPDPNTNLSFTPLSLTAERCLRERVELMRRLSDNLCRSRQAVVALDLAAIEHGTREQAALSLRLASLIRRMEGGFSAFARGTKTEDSGHNLVALGCQLRMMEGEVMQALRVQAALLERAQYKLRVLGNALAGSNVNYGPSLVKMPVGTPVKSGISRAGWNRSGKRALGA
jgi:hypothetical protein